MIGRFAHFYGLELPRRSNLEILHADGSEPLGIAYASKTMFGRCYAFWDRRADLGLSPGMNDLEQLNSWNVGPDPDFNYVADHYELPRLSR